MNHTLEDARKGAKDIGMMLESKKLRANTSKSKFVVIGTPESRIEILKEAEEWVKQSSRIQKLRNISVIRYMKEEHLPVSPHH